MNTKDMFLGLSASAQNLVPDLFLEQARQGYQKFFVGHDQLQPRLCQLVLQNPKRSIDPETNEEFVTAKIQLNMILASGVNPANGQPTLEMVALGPNKNKMPNQFWAKGFYSLLLRFDKNLVAGGFITADEQRFLFDYVGLWETNGDDNYKAGSDAAKQRIYLRTKNADAVFEFGLEERYDRENQPVPGMTAIGWTPGGLELFGTGVTGTPVAIQAAVESHKTPGTRSVINRPIAATASTPATVGARTL